MKKAIIDEFPFKLCYLIPTPECHEDLKTRILSGEIECLEYGFVLIGEFEKLFVCAKLKSGNYEYFGSATNIRDIVCDAIYINSIEIRLLKEDLENLSDRESMIELVFSKIISDMNSGRTLFLFPFYIYFLNEIIDFSNNGILFRDFDSYIIEAENTSNFIKQKLDSGNHSNLSASITYRWANFISGPIKIVDSYRDFIIATYIDCISNDYRYRHCVNCGKWFCNGKNQHKIYCNRDINGKTCAEIGRKRGFIGQIDGDLIKEIYSDHYARYYMRVKRGKIPLEKFKLWHKEAKEIKRKYKNHIITEDEALEWFRNNKFD